MRNIAIFDRANTNFDMFIPRQLVGIRVIGCWKLDEFKAANISELGINEWHFYVVNNYSH